MSWPKSTESIFPPPLELGEVKNLWIMHLKVSNTATFKKLSFYQFPSSLWTYFLKGKTPSVIPLWRPFLMPMKGARSKVPCSGHFRWLSQCQDWFTKSGGHARSLKLETWNFAWDLISPIHMLCKKGLIWEHFEKMVQPGSDHLSYSSYFLKHFIPYVENTVLTLLTNSGLFFVSDRHLENFSKHIQFHRGQWSELSLLYA